MKTPADLLREMEALKEDVRTISERQRRLLDAARQVLAGTKPSLRPDEALKT